VLRDSLGSDASTVSAVISPAASTTRGEVTHRQSEHCLPAGIRGPSLAPAAVQDLLHLLLHSLHQLARLRSQQLGGSPSSAAAQFRALPNQQAAGGDSFQNEIDVARFTVQTLLLEVERPAAGNVPTALAGRQMTADGTQTLWPQQDITAAASQTPASEQAEHATQTKGHGLPNQSAAASQTDGAVPDVTGLQVEQQCRRADKWKSRCKQAQLDLAAAQSAAAEAAGTTVGHEAVHEALLVPEASTSLHPGSGASTGGPRQQDDSQQTEEAVASRESCDAQLRAAASVSDALAAANAELRSALAAQRSDTDAARQTLENQLGAAQASERQAADEAAGVRVSLAAAGVKSAALVSDLQAEKERSVALETRLRAETDKVSRARAAVLDTVDKLKKVVESANGQAQLVQAQQRTMALETALHEALEKLARRRTQFRALLESHAQAVATLQASLQAAEATVSSLRTRYAEEVASREQSQQQQDHSVGEMTNLRDSIGEAARCHENTLQELQAARDSLAGVASAAASAAEPDGCCVRPGLAGGLSLVELSQQASDAVSKLTKRTLNLEAMLRLMESDADRAVSEALAVNDTAQRAVQESQTARASEAAALSACEALQATIRELRQQHELECLALGERHVADMQNLQVAMLESRAVLEQREAKDAADCLGQSQADAETAHANQLAACRAQHAAKLEAQIAQHAAEIERVQKELAGAASADDVIKEHFMRYQAQRAEEVASLERRLRVVLQQPPQTPGVIKGSMPPCVKNHPGLVRRGVQSTAGKHVKAAKPARRQQLRTTVINDKASLQHVERAPEPATAEANREAAPGETARVILAAMESDAKAAAAREAELERTQRQVAEAALAQATSAVDALRERVRGLQRELAASKERAIAAEVSAAAAREQHSSARQQSSQLQVLATPWLSHVFSCIASATGMHP